MKTFIKNNLVNSISLLDSKEQSMIFKMLPSALANVPFHKNTDAVTRYVARDFPLHLAVHEVSLVLMPPPEYTEPHLHDNYDEINIILSEKELLYKIQLEEEIFTIRNNSSIWIPRGTIHAANVLAGSGYFITIRI